MVVAAVSEKLGTLKNRKEHSQNKLVKLAALPATRQVCVLSACAAPIVAHL